MAMSFGPNDPNSLPALLGRMTPGMTPGPVPSQQITPGFRAPGAGGAPGLPQMAQTPGMGMGMGMDPQAMASLMASLGSGPGENEQKVNGVLDATGMSDPMAQGAAQSADMQSGPWAWLKGAMKGLF